MVTAKVTRVRGASRFVGGTWQPRSVPPRRRPADPPTVARNIHFFRADTGTGDDGRPVRLDIDAVLAAVDSLPFAPVDHGGRYLPQADGEDLCAWVDAGASPQRLRLARLRRNALPQAEMAGRLSDVALASGAALYEAVHLLFLPDNVIAAEFNFYGPRPTRLPGYLEALFGDLPTPFVMEQLLRQDAAEQLDGQSGLRLLDLRVRPSYAATVGQADPSLGAALEAAAAVGEADLVGVVLQAEPRTRSARLAQGLLSGLRRLARRPDLRDNATRFEVTGIGPDGLVEKINVLSDALVSVQQVARVGRTSRAVDRESAYGAVEAAYRQAMQSGLLEGPGVSEVQG